MIVLWVVLGFCLYVGVGIWWLNATANGYSTPLHMHHLMNYPVNNTATSLLLETLRILVVGVAFYVVAEYAVHKAIRRKKRRAT